MPIVRKNKTKQSKRVNTANIITGGGWGLRRKNLICKVWSEGYYRLQLTETLQHGGPLYKQAHYVSKPVTCQVAYQAPPLPTRMVAAPPNTEKSATQLHFRRQPQGALAEYKAFYLSGIKWIALHTTLMHVVQYAILRY